MSTRFVRLGRKWTVLTCTVAIGLCTAVFGQQKERPASGASLDEIVAVWKARQNAVRTLHVEWREDVVFGDHFVREESGQKKETTKAKGSHAVPADQRTQELTVSLTLDGDKAHGVHDEAVISSTKGIVLTKSEWVSGHSGSGFRILNNPGTNPYPDGTEETPDVMIVDHITESPRFLPLFATLRPFSAYCHRFDDLAKRFEITPMREVVDGKSAIRLNEISQHDRRLLTSLWVDPERDFVVMRLKQSLGGTRLFDCSVTEFVRSEGVWVPVKWNFESLNPDGSSLAGTHAVVTSQAINQPVAPSEFVLEFPVGAVIFDHTAQSEYLVEEGGQKRYVTREDFRSGNLFKDLANSAPGAPPVMRPVQNQNPFWIISGMVALLLLIVIFIVRKWSSRRHRHN